MKGAPMEFRVASIWWLKACISGVQIRAIGGWLVHFRRGPHGAEDADGDDDDDDHDHDDHDGPRALTREKSQQHIPRHPFSCSLAYPSQLAPLIAYTPTLESRH